MPSTRTGRRDWELSLPWNVAWFYRINQARRPSLDWLYEWYYHFGKTQSLVLAIPLFGWIGGHGGLLHLGIALVLDGVVLWALKRHFRHQRPGRLLPRTYNMENLFGRSFPSADAGYAFTILGVALFVMPPWGLPLVVLYALSIGFGRIYMGSHFPLDILVGAMIGLAAATLTGFGLAGLGPGPIAG